VGGQREAREEGSLWKSLTEVPPEREWRAGARRSSGREGSGREWSWWQRLKVVMASEAAISVAMVVAVMVVVVVVTANVRRP
jgi:hypothetical protein